MSECNHFVRDDVKMRRHILKPLGYSGFGNASAGRRGRGPYNMQSARARTSDIISLAR
jgi:hypothetical protein